MRVMAIDYGDARTGIAVSDRTGTLTGDAWTISERNTARLVETILDEIKKREVTQIVLGYPKNMNGTIGARAEKTETLRELLLAQSGLPVALWDERRTSVAADHILVEVGRRGKKKKAVQDAVAASLILEGYLRSQ